MSEINNKEKEKQRMLKLYAKVMQENSEKMEDYKEAKVLDNKGKSIFKIGLFVLGVIGVLNGGFFVVISILMLISPEGFIGFLIFIPASYSLYKSIILIKESMED